MVEIELDMDYLFDIRRASKLQLRSRGTLDCGDAKNLEMKFQDGKILHWYSEVEKVLYVEDLYDDDLSVNEYIEKDEELSDSLNDSEAIIFAKYMEI
jgi:hypothetical protein